jgi:adenylate cyclase
MSMAGGSAAPLAPTVAPDCVICGTALSGPLGYFFRAVGISRSSRNPNLCNRCNTHTEEGRIVELTVLFADISSFTELTHELGPERTHQVVDAFLKSVTYILVKHGAFIDKYVGDAVMAFFNVPIRSADHGARAVEAAREILAELPALRERLGFELNASLGIASGWAHVGRLGSGDNKDYTAIGDVVNLAARLEGQARSGEIVIDAGVFEQIAERFPEQGPETLALKGFRDPVTAYRLGATSEPIAPAVTASAHRELRSGRAFNLGAIIFAILGAPCAAVALIGPLAVALGLGSLFGALGTSVLPVLDSAPVRIPLLTIVTLGSLANLYTLWHARRLRQQAAAEERFIPVTQLEQRRSRFVLFSAVFTLLVVAYELYAHQFITQ